MTVFLIYFQFRSILVQNGVYADYEEQLFLTLILEILAIMWVSRTENRFSNLLEHTGVLTSIYTKNNFNLISRYVTAPSNNLPPTEQHKLRIASMGRVHRGLFENPDYYNQNIFTHNPASSMLFIRMLMNLSE